MEGPLTNADPQSSNGSTSQSVPQVTQSTDGSISPSVPQVKDESLSQVKCDPTKKVKSESSSAAREVKADPEEFESKEENPASVKQEERPPDPDSEDSFTPERVVEEVQRLLGVQESRIGASEQPEGGREAIPPPAPVTPRERVSASETTREQGYGPYAPQGIGRARQRYSSPDPFLFNTTIFLEHTASANEKHKMTR